ncbi:ribulose-phosphate 3-epimerase [Clostridium sp. SYSU_GA19001]|uniref:ribulose-phosphate 3-epimerase n=1 Tax=Clostridium caldaquaticum TaxID=2940653 RepID=UPI002076F0C6|nr:ribulose-phosphate 3-epimerase [Clostridium caldaquaticum]MCM8710007.1 ribulose-phosphate 3-epimerase [Clostridium caldaquaticum]
MIKIAPSIMCADFLNLGKDIKDLQDCGSYLFHIDVMDGNFVPNFSLNQDVVRTIKTIAKIPIEVHMMVENPEKYVESFAEAGASYIGFHLEASKSPIRTLKRIKELGLKAGIAINPATSEATIKYLLEYLDYIVVMTVEPGFAGQKFIPSVLQKIRVIKNMIKDANRQIEIIVDGNIDVINGKKCVKAGADILVGGTSSVFKKGQTIEKSFNAFIQTLENELNTSWNNISSKILDKSISF